MYLYCMIYNITTRQNKKTLAEMVCNIPFGRCTRASVSVCWWGGGGLKNTTWFKIIQLLLSKDYGYKD